MSIEVFSITHSGHSLDLYLSKSPFAQGGLWALSNGVFPSLSSSFPNATHHPPVAVERGLTVTKGVNFHQKKSFREHLHGQIQRQKPLFSQSNSVGSSHDGTSCSDLHVQLHEICPRTFFISFIPSVLPSETHRKELTRA